MYASQTKRLCVRGASSDETRVQHHSTSSETLSTNSTPNNNNTSFQDLKQQQSIESSDTVLGGGGGAVGETAATAQQLVNCNLNNMTASTNQLISTPILNNNSLQSSSSSSIQNNSTNSNHSTSTFQATAFNIYHQNNQDSKDAIDEQALAAAVAASASISKQSSECDLINKLANETIEEKKLELILSIRNLITACNKKKDSIVNNPNFIKVINLIDNEQQNGHSTAGSGVNFNKRLHSTVVKAQLALLMCSVAKGGEQNVRVLNESLADDKIFNLLLNTQDDLLIEACLRCLRSIMSWPRVSRTWLLYEERNMLIQTQSNTNTNNDNINNNNLETKKNIDLVSKQSDSGSCNNLHKIIRFAQERNSFIIQECVADIFASTCNRLKDQLLLFAASALDCIVQLLESPSHRVIVSALEWLTQMCLKNHYISTEILTTKCPSGILVLDKLTNLMSKEQPNEVQFLSARCFAYIYRALEMGTIKHDFRIISYVLPTLVRMVHKDKPAHLRIKSAECIAYLVESDVPLQNTASFCDHLIESLANMLEYEHNIIVLDSKNFTQKLYKCSQVQDRGVSWLSIVPSTQQPPALDLRQTTQTTDFIRNNPIEFINTNCTMNQNNDYDLRVDRKAELNLEMKRVAFLALAALASNLEAIRTKILNTSTVMPNLFKSLTDTDSKTLISVLACLLSLSRSVQQLRTSFADGTIYSALKGLLNTTSNEVLILVLAILCNISLDFSPGKQQFLDAKTIEILCNFTRSQDNILRLHAMWILMNIVYQLRDQDLKFQILKSLNIQHVLNIMESDEDEEIVLKTCGFLRNILSQKMHIDAIMNNYGEQIILSLARMLKKSCSNTIKEQCLCILTNIADGAEAKAFIMRNRNILNYLSDLIEDNQAGDMRLAAICCITNLIHREFEGSTERREQLKALGIEEKLRVLLSSTDPALSDRVRTAYNQFFERITRM